jgi:poly-gamma-glutamate synthesis protein (capsule biosynthesis protein)
MEMYKDYVEKYKYFAGPNLPGVAALNEDSLRIDIEAMRPLVDVLIVSVHWGDDYKPVRQLQRDFGRLAIDFGADAVISHHSHSYQPVDIYKGRPILYSLGNFVFGSPSRTKYEAFPGEERSFCCGMPVIVHIDAVHKKIKMIEFIPILTQNQAIGFTPRRPSEDEAQSVLEQLRRDSNINNRNFEVIPCGGWPAGAYRILTR